MLPALALAEIFVFADIVLTARLVATGAERRNLVLVAIAASWMLFTDAYLSILAGTMVFGAFVFTLYSLSAATANDRGTLLLRIGDRQAALVAYRRALSLTPGDAPSRELLQKRIDELERGAGGS